MMTDWTWALKKTGFPEMTPKFHDCLEQGLENFSSKRPDDKYSRLCGPYGFLQLLNSAVLQKQPQTTVANRHGSVPVRPYLTQETGQN